MTVRPCQIGLEQAQLETPGWKLSGPWTDPVAACCTWNVSMVSANAEGGVSASASEITRKSERLIAGFLTSHRSDG